MRKQIFFMSFNQYDSLDTFCSEPGNKPPISQILWYQIAFMLQFNLAKFTLRFAIQLWNPNPTFTIWIGYALTALGSPSSICSERTTSEGSVTSQIYSDFWKTLTGICKKATLTLATAFTSAQMHFVNSLEQLSGGNSFKVTTCKHCENHKGTNTAHKTEVQYQPVFLCSLNKALHRTFLETHFYYICQSQNSFLHHVLPAGEDEFSTAY